MKKIRLGNSGIEVTQLGLGCINFGSTTTRDAAFELMDTYLEQGGNLLDTANNYAVWNGGDGKESEKTIGKWIHARNNRQDYVLATKLGAYPKDINNKKSSNMQGLSRKIILEEVEKSLTNLQTDYLDILYLHADDYNTPQEETMQTLNELVRQGLVRELGCCNFRIWRVERARHICTKYGYKFFCAIQQRYSYLQPTLDADFFPQIAANGELAAYIDYYRDITMVSHTSLLYGQYTKDTIELTEYDTAENREKLARLRSEEKDPVAWVLKYITEQFGGSVALFTTSNAAHLIQNMRYFD